MSKALNTLNFLGILVLAGLCVFQWQVNRRLNLQAIEQEKHLLQLQQQNRDLEKMIEGQKSDLQTVKDQFMKSHEELAEIRKTKSVLERNILELETERDQLKSSIADWSEAINKRDEQIRSANDQLTRLASERNDSVLKYNSLAEKYNSLVEDFNKANAQLSKIAGQTNKPQNSPN
ncbi:MAG: hypothetical protein SFY81_16760 [Verrucomicrobiota bacterium]|nr:hypothetical protein [Verrucomicrobiota bacterium]